MEHIQEMNDFLNETKDQKQFKEIGVEDDIDLKQYNIGKKVVDQAYNMLKLEKYSDDKTVLRWKIDGPKLSNEGSGPFYGFNAIENNDTEFKNLLPNIVVKYFINNGGKIIVANFAKSGKDAETTITSLKEFQSFMKKQ
jgi:hypothetical protein